MEPDKKTDTRHGKSELDGGSSSRFSMSTYPETAAPLSRLRGNNVNETWHFVYRLQLYYNVDNVALSVPSL